MKKTSSKKHTAVVAAAVPAPVPDVRIPYQTRIAQLEAFIANGLKTATWNSTEATALLTP